MQTTLVEIFRDSETQHRLSLFDLADLKTIEAGLFEKNGKPYLKCLATDKDRPAKPEEIVRQLWIKRLLTQYGYPKSRLTVEHPVKFGSETKRADIVVFDKDRPNVEYIIVELKKTKLKEGKDQLKSYCNATGAPIGVWSNGEQYSFYNRKDPNYFNDLTEIPSATQSLTDILNERFTLDDLVKRDKLVTERKSLKDLILEMEDEVPMIRPFNLRDAETESNNLVFLSEADVGSKDLKMFTEGDVLFARVGDVGCGVLTHTKATISPNIIAADLERSRLNPYYTAVFFNTRFGRIQMESEVKAVAQPTISTDSIRRFRIAPLSQKFQEEVERTFKASKSALKKSQRLVCEAAELLFCGLQLEGWQPNDSPTCTRSATEVFAAARFDAEYFRPRYQSLLALLRHQGKTLRDVARLREDMFTPQPGQPFHYIEIGDLAADGAATSHEVPGEEAPSRATWIVQPGDVITSTVRPIRCLTGLIEPEQAENICSSGFAVLTPKRIPGELLFAYLRLPVICELMDLHTTASMYPAISTTDLMRLPFLLPDDATIKKVKHQITAARTARREAHVLLEKAKQAVEIAIEKDEAAGMAMLH